VCCRCRQQHTVRKEARAPAHEGLDTNIWCCRCRCFVAVAVARWTINNHKARALAHDWLMNSLWKLESLCACAWCLRQLWHECDVVPWRYCNCSYLVKMLGELKKWIDHPCFGMARGRPIMTFGPIATMLCGFIFEGLMYAPIRNLIAVVGGLQSNRNQLSTLVPPIIWIEWHCAFAQFHTVKCWR
jgi:hypothetical protein